MTSVNKITPKKFNLTANDYDLIYMLFKDNMSNIDIAKRLKLSTGQVSIVLSQIVTYIQVQKKHYDVMIAEKNFKLAGESSIKDLYLPVDEEATIGSVKVINNKIYHNGIVWK